MNLNGFSNKIRSHLSLKLNYEKPIDFFIKSVLKL